MKPGRKLTMDEVVIDVVKHKDDPFWAPWYIRWAARLVVRHMTRNAISSYQVTGKVIQSNATIQTMDCEAKFLLHWVLRCCGYELAPKDIENKYLKNKTLVFSKKKRMSHPWT